MRKTTEWPFRVFTMPENGAAQFQTVFHRLSMGSFTK
jgi:hypothetical protein